MSHDQVVERTVDDPDGLIPGLREALGDTECRLTFTWALNVQGVRHGVLVEHRSGYKGPWRKHKYAVYPGENETVADVMHTLATMREEIQREQQADRD